MFVIIWNNVEHDKNILLQSKKFNAQMLIKRCVFTIIGAIDSRIPLGYIPIMKIPIQ